MPCREKGILIWLQSIWMQQTLEKLSIEEANLLLMLATAKETAAPRKKQL